MCCLLNLFSWLIISEYYSFFVPLLHQTDTMNEMCEPQNITKMLLVHQINETIQNMDPKAWKMLRDFFVNHPNLGKGSSIKIITKLLTCGAENHKVDECFAYLQTFPPSVLQKETCNGLTSSLGDDIIRYITFYLESEDLSRFCQVNRDLYLLCHRYGYAKHRGLNQVRKNILQVQSSADIGRKIPNICPQEVVVIDWVPTPAMSWMYHKWFLLCCSIKICQLNVLKNIPIDILFDPLHPMGVLSKFEICDSGFHDDKQQSLDEFAHILNHECLKPRSVESLVWSTHNENGDPLDVSELIAACRCNFTGLVLNGPMGIRKKMLGKLFHPNLKFLQLKAGGSIVVQEMNGERYRPQNITLMKVSTPAKELEKLCNVCDFSLVSVLAVDGYNALSRDVLSNFEGLSVLQYVACRGPRGLEVFLWSLLRYHDLLLHKTLFVEMSASSSWKNSFVTVAPRWVDTNMKTQPLVEGNRYSTTSEDMSRIFNHCMHFDSDWHFCFELSVPSL